jgi:putative membrane protein
MAASVPSSPLSLSDQLALERTRLANERTVLAYLRTGMALCIGGLSLINFFRDNIYVWLGVLCLPLGLGLVGLGWMRYRVKRRHIAAALGRPA